MVMPLRPWTPGEEITLGATCDDPLVWWPGVSPWPGVEPYLGAGDHWMAMVLSQDGDVPERISGGLTIPAVTLEESVGIDLGGQAMEAGLPWCGPCPSDPTGTCAYLYSRGIPAGDRAAPLAALTEDDVAADPLCE